MFSVGGDKRGINSQSGAAQEASAQNGESGSGVKIMSAIFRFSSIQIANRLHQSDLGVRYGILTHLSAESAQEKGLLESDQPVARATKPSLWRPKYLTNCPASGGTGSGNVEPFSSITPIGHNRFILAKRKPAVPMAKTDRKSVV